MFEELGEDGRWKIAAAPARRGWATATPSEMGNHRTRNSEGEKRKKLILKKSQAVFTAEAIGLMKSEWKRWMGLVEAEARAKEDVATN